jgi:hypothetical protein
LNKAEGFIPPAFAVFVFVFSRFLYGIVVSFLLHKQVSELTVREEWHFFQRISIRELILSLSPAQKLCRQHSGNQRDRGQHGRIAFAIPQSRLIPRLLVARIKASFPAEKWHLIKTSSS